MFSFFKRKTKLAASLYLCVQKGVRQPKLYLNFGVHDTIEGRLEMLYLHAALLTHRLLEAPKEISQEFIEELFSNMDAELREIGVGDTKIAKKIKDMGKSFYGRLAAYEAADLTDALTRNVPLHKTAHDLNIYVLDARHTLKTMSIEQICAASSLFGEIND